MGQGMYVCTCIMGRPCTQRQAAPTTISNHRRRPSMALLEAHAGHAMPPEWARGEVIRVAWWHEAWGAGSGETQRPGRKELQDTCLSRPCSDLGVSGHTCRERGTASPTCDTRPCIRVRHNRPVIPLHSPPTPPKHAHHPLCLTPISFLLPRGPTAAAQARK